MLILTIFPGSPLWPGLPGAPGVPWTPIDPCNKQWIPLTWQIRSQIQFRLWLELLRSVYNNNMYMHAYIHTLKYVIIHIYTHELNTCKCNVIMCLQLKYYKILRATVFPGIPLEPLLPGTPATPCMPGAP